MCKINNFYHFSINCLDQSRKLCYIQNFEEDMMFNLITKFIKEGWACIILSHVWVSIDGVWIGNWI
jgi:hypothetical protein